MTCRAAASGQGSVSVSVWRRDSELRELPATDQAIRGDAR